MNFEDVVTHLCFYDTRNPDGVISCSSEEDIKEGGLTTKAKDNCYCNNCFRGKTALAEELLKYITKPPEGA